MTRYAPIVLNATDEIVKTLDEAFRFRVRFCDPLYLGTRLMPGRDSRIFRDDSPVHFMMAVGSTVAEKRNKDCQPLFISGNASRRFVLAALRSISAASACLKRETSAFILNSSKISLSRDIASGTIGDVTIVRNLPETQGMSDWAFLPDRSELHEFFSYTKVLHPSRRYGDSLPGDMIEGGVDEERPADMMEIFRKFVRVSSYDWIGGIGILPIRI